MLVGTVVVPSLVVAVITGTALVLVAGALVLVLVLEVGSGTPVLLLVGTKVHVSLPV